MGEWQLLSWNVNGIRAVQKKGFLEWLAKESPDILCVQETKAQPDQLTNAMRDVAGYHTHYCSAERKGYSGVAIYSRPQPTSVTCGLGIEEFDSEGRVIAAEYDDFILFNVYFPNGKASPQRLTYKMNFYAAFQEHVTSLTGQGKSVIVCGDVNTAHKPIDLARPKENEKSSGFLPEERAWIDGFLDAGFIDTFRHFDQRENQYSWWDYKTRARDRNIGWRIDYFFASHSLKENLTGAFIRQDVTGSDHCPVGITLSF